MEIKARAQAFIETVRDDPKRLAYWMVSGLPAFWNLHSCIPGLYKDALPAELLADIQREHITCISTDDTPVWSGKTRQPECGRFEVEMAEESVVQPSEQQTGFTRATCYRITVENPRWQAMG